MDGQQHITDTRRKGSPNGAKPQFMDAKKDSELSHQLSMRCSQFLSSMSQLEDTWQASQWFDDLWKSHTLDETISFEGLRNLLTSFIKEVKDKHDVQRRSTAEWFLSEITYINQLLKGEQHNTSTQPQSFPAHLEVMLKDVKPMLSSIHVKLDAVSKETKSHGKNVSSVQSSTPNIAKSQISSPNSRIKALEKDKLQLSKDLEQKGKNSEKSLKNAESDLAVLRKDNAALEKKHREADQNVRDLQQSLKNAESDLAVLRKDNAALEKKHREADQNVRDLQQRYSALAGAKMAHENPDIADLSDPYRPTKIAEMFSELYDNQWTDGFASLEKHGDQKAIQILMDILKETNAFCKNETQSLRQSLRSKIQEICTLQDRKPKQPTKGQADLLKDRRIDDIIRDNAMLPVNILQQKFLKESEPKRKDLKTDKVGVKAVTEYVEKCVELCWLMAIQSPPVAIDDNVEKYKKQRFDDRRFKPYTKKGQVIDYVVWPMLSISGGGMLGKGVAQCK